jgi:hypothetical protein
MPTEPNDSPPLEYRTPGSDGADTAWLTMSFIVGLITSVVAAAMATWVGVLGLSGLTDNKALDAAPFIYFAGAAVVGVIFTVWVRRGRTMSTEAPLRRGRFVMLGFLLGLGVIWLLQGICFAALSRLDSGAG